jgi:hypothetical protein
MGRARPTENGYESVRVRKRIEAAFEAHASGFDGVFGTRRGISALQRAEREEKENTPHPFAVDHGMGAENICYYLNNDRETGILHRLGGPARVGKTEDGESIEEWYWEGELHRDDDKPASVTVSGDGETIIRRWYVHGKLHRLGAPARIETRSDGTLIEHYHYEGSLHREDGPAIIAAYGTDDEPTEAVFYLHGVQQGEGLDYKLDEERLAAIAAGRAAATRRR